MERRSLASTKAQIKTIDLAGFKRGFDEKNLGLLIDVGEPGEFAGGHVRGAVNIPRNQIEFKIWGYVGYPERADLAKKITIYCGTGSRCVLAAKSLQDLKFRNVVEVDMRIEDWQKAGYPLEE